MKAILQTAAGNPENQDRGLVLEDDARSILCVADGAGGLSGAVEAADMAIEIIRRNASLMNSKEACVEALRNLDAAIASDPIAGETTCVFAIVTAEMIFGASVGDSGVWLIPDNGKPENLTHAQQRKPLIGSDQALPVAFHTQRSPGTLLLATDGLLKYSGAESIIATCKQRPIISAAKQLIESVRYASGALPDDVTLIITQL